MRDFRLINNDGASYNLTEKGALFFYNVDGLGYDRDVQFQRIGDHLSLINDNLGQGTITGIIKFWNPDAYGKYFKFAQFCQNKPLQLVYAPESTEFFRSGYVTKIGKSESESGALVATVEFKTTTPWYRMFSSFNSGEIKGGKIYDFKYDYQYSEGIQQAIILNSDSYQDSPCKLTIFGPATNPRWSHYVNNRLMVTGMIKGSIEANHKLVIDTTTIPYSICQYDLSDNLISDMYQLSDYSTERFITLGYGENIVSVTHSGSNILKLGLEARIEYATV